MRKLAFLLLLLSVTGCRRSSFPAKVQPAEFDLYHAYILHYAKNYPQDEQKLYIAQTVSGGAFLTEAEKNPANQTAYAACLSPQAHAAFQAAANNSYQLDEASSNAWRTLPDGKVLPLTDSPKDPKVQMASISFSRAFITADGKEAYLNTEITKCSGACGGESKLWHAVRQGDQWILSATKCYGLE